MADLPFGMPAIGRAAPGAPPGAPPAQTGTAAPTLSGMLQGGNPFGVPGTAAATPPAAPAPMTGGAVGAPAPMSSPPPFAAGTAMPSAAPTPAAAPTAMPAWGGAQPGAGRMGFDQAFKTWSPQIQQAFSPFQHFFQQRQQQAPQFNMQGLLSRTPQQFRGSLPPQFQPNS